MQPLRGKEPTQGGVPQATLGLGRGTEFVLDEVRSKRAAPKCIRQVIEADQPEASHNVYFSGDQYGIVIDDFRDLLDRIYGELEDDSVGSPNRDPPTSSMG